MQGFSSHFFIRVKLCWFVVNGRMEMFLKLALVILTQIYLVQSVIQQVDDSDLVHLLTKEENIVVLFTKNNCQECDELESVVENIQNELKDDMAAVVVKAHNSHMVGLYNPTKEPALLYFRRGMPLLYYGLPVEEEIVRVFSENKEPVVKELSDSNFEQLTQAATGATTGDWFLFFYSADCVLCLRLHAVWEAVGARLKHRLNVARINRLEAGNTTAKRFGIVESPEFLLLRQGKIYRFKMKEYTAGNFIEFAERGFLKQTSPEIVPPESTALNNILGDYIGFVNNYQFWILSSFCILSTIILGFFIKQVLLKRAALKNSNKKGK